MSAKLVRPYCVHVFFMRHQQYGSTPYWILYAPSAKAAKQVKVLFKLTPIGGRRTVGETHVELNAAVHEKWGGCLVFVTLGLEMANAGHDLLKANTAFCTVLHCLVLCLKFPGYNLKSCGEDKVYDHKNYMDPYVQVKPLHDTLVRIQAGETPA